jgi:hypothetical protein
MGRRWHYPRRILGPGADISQSATLAGLAPPTYSLVAAQEDRSEGFRETGHHQPRQRSQAVLASGLPSHSNVVMEPEERFAALVSEFVGASRDHTPR